VTENQTPYPVRVDAELEPRLSRGLWLVKWLLLIPHYLVLAFLWVAFVVLSVVAFFAILFTGRYPRAIFDFNLGVMRWSWRVQYYGYAALGTDRYPPFTLADVPDYPARLQVPYPERLSRGLVLVKWWLLAIPHYLVLAVFIGGGLWLGTRPSSGDSGWDSGWAFGGLVGLLVFVAGVVLLFSGGYPRPVFDFVLGMDRWVLRVAAYVSLMTDAYPPFRLDTGGPDPGSLPSGPVLPTAPAGAAAPVVQAASGYPAPGAGATAQGPTPYGPPAPPRSSWTPGRIVSVVIGALLMFTATGLLAAGGGLLWADQTQRTDGFVLSPTDRLATSGYAISSDTIRLDTGGEQWVLDDFLGDARLEATARDPGVELFVGVAPTAAVAGYLGGVQQRVVTDLGPGMLENHGIDLAGTAPAQAPGDLDIWTATSTGTGTQVVDWRPTDGNWTVVVMRADAAAGVDVEARAGATVPGLGWLAVGLLVAGGLAMAAGALLVALAVHRAHRAGPQAGVPALPQPRVPAGNETQTGTETQAGTDTQAGTGAPA
jgi:hypothetical protein